MPPAGVGNNKISDTWFYRTGYRFFAFNEVLRIKCSVYRALEQAFLLDTNEQGRKGPVLTRKTRMIPYGARFGFTDEGISGSTHGDAVWHRMRLTF